MLKSNLLNGGSTNIRLSSTALDILISDCFAFGFLKSGKANVTYIISKLIKELTEYRNDLHSELSKNNNYNEKLVRTIENNIFNLYLKTLNYICDDSYANVGYRISKEFMPCIKNIFYETLEKFDMDFASYTRSIIYEYCSRTKQQRELFINYSLLKLIKCGIKKERIATIVSEEKQYELVLAGVEPSENGFNYLLGLTPDRKMCVYLPICKIDKLELLKNKMRIGQEDYDRIIDNFYKFLEEGK